MNFFSWKKNHVLLVNNYGMLEPLKSKVKIPNLLLVPILAFDRDKYRLGYGKGFYDRYLNKYLKKIYNIFYCWLLLFHFKDIIKFRIIKMMLN